MSDIGASDAVVTPEAAPVEAVETTEAFDLDAAVEDFATNAPEEWKSKASKIQSELKGLRTSRNELRDRYESFEGLHADDFSAVNTLVTALKAGDTDGAATWLFNAAKGLTGEQFEAKFGLTKAEAQEAVDAVADDSEVEAEPELSIQEQINKALEERDNAHKAQVEAQERQANINATFTELGYDVTRRENGTLANLETQMVAQLAVNDHKGDIKAAHEAFQTLQADWAKAYLQKNAGDSTLAPTDGTSVQSIDPETAEKLDSMTTADRAKAKAKARLMRAASGPQA